MGLSGFEPWISQRQRAYGVTWLGTLDLLKTNSLWGYWVWNLGSPRDKELMWLPGLEPWNPQEVPTITNKNKKKQLLEKYMAKWKSHFL